MITTNRSVLHRLMIRDFMPLYALLEDRRTEFVVGPSSHTQNWFCISSKVSSWFLTGLMRSSTELLRSSLPSTMSSASLACIVATFFLVFCLIFFSSFLVSGLAAGSRLLKVEEFLGRVGEAESSFMAPQLSRAALSLICFSSASWQPLELVGP